MATPVMRSPNWRLCIVVVVVFLLVLGALSAIGGALV